MRFNHPNKKTFYIAGGTVWYEEAEDNLKKYEPDVIVLNSGDAAPAWFLPYCRPEPAPRCLCDVIPKNWSSFELE